MKHQFAHNSPEGGHEGRQVISSQVKSLCLRALVAIFLIVRCVSAANAQSITQQVVATYGHYGASGGYSLSATGGELMVETFYATPNAFTQGFQQPQDVFVGVHESIVANWNWSYFPNPVSDELQVKVEAKASADITVSLYDLRGVRLLLPTLQKLDGETHSFEIDTRNIALGVYILHIEEAGRSPRTASARIVKVN